MKINYFFASTVTALMATVSVGFVAEAGTIRHDRSDSLYRNLAAGFPSVGYLSASNSAGGWGCSGTLIAQSYVLTAAHCVENSNGWMNQGTFWLGNQKYTVNGVGANSNWFSSGRNLGLGVDLAILSLSSSVWNVNPAMLYTSSDEDLKLGTYVGFGATGTGDTGYYRSDSVKRAGQNTMGIGTRLGWSDRLLVSDFDDPRWAWSDPLSQAQNLEYQLAPGDSGGGMFIDGRVAGVHSFISSTDGSTNADYGDTSASVRVSSSANWIRSGANYLAQLLGRSTPTIAGSSGTTSTGAGWNRQAEAPLADEYNWFDDSISVESFILDELELTQFASGLVFDGENLREPQSVPEPSMVVGLLALVGLGWHSRKHSKAA